VAEAVRVSRGQFPIAGQRGGRPRVFHAIVFVKGVRSRVVRSASSRDRHVLLLADLPAR
jgi:hypothetical protein